MKQTVLTLEVLECPSEYAGSRQIEIGTDGGTIGRSPAATFTLADNDKYISSSHCLVTIYNDEYYINDVSTNGTYVNGAKLNRNQPQHLSHNDAILIGRYKFNVVVEIYQRRQDIAADILPEQQENDPLALLDDISFTADSGRVSGFGEIFPELNTAPDIDSDDPLEHLPTMHAQSLIDDEPVAAPQMDMSTQEQRLDDSEDIHAEMMMPLIPEDWHADDDEVQGQQPQGLSGAEVLPNTQQSAPSKSNNPQAGLSQPSGVSSSVSNASAESMIPDDFLDGLNAAHAATVSSFDTSGPTSVAESPQPIIEAVSPFEDITPASSVPTSPAVAYEEADTTLVMEGPISGGDAYAHAVSIDSEPTASSQPITMTPPAIENTRPHSAELGATSELVEALFKGLGLDASKVSLAPAFVESMGKGIRSCLSHFAEHLNDSAMLKGEDLENQTDGHSLLSLMADLYHEHQIEPLELFEQVIDDTKTHHDNMVLASQKAAKRIVDQVSPNSIISEAGKSVLISGKGKYWDRYVSHHQVLWNGFDETFEDSVKQVYTEVGV